MQRRDRMRKSIEGESNETISEACASLSLPWLRSELAVRRLFPPLIDASTCRVKYTAFNTWRVSAMTSKRHRRLAVRVIRIVA